MEDNLNFFKNGRQPQFFHKWKMTSMFSQIEEDLSMNPKNTNSLHTLSFLDQNVLNSEKELAWTTFACAAFSRSEYLQIFFSSDLGGLLQHLIDYCYYGKLLKNFWINIYQWWSFLLYCRHLPEHSQWFQPHLLGLQLWQVWWGMKTSQSKMFSRFGFKKCFSVICLSVTITISTLPLLPSLGN